jgi:hypothetical protein
MCYDGGTLYLCKGCPRAYHDECLNPSMRVKVQGFGGFYCPQHECVDCGSKTTDAGGMIYRCRWCPNGYCEDCLGFDQSILVGDITKELQMLDYPSTSQAYYIVCPQCTEQMNEEPSYKSIVEQRMDDIDQEFDNAQTLPPLTESPTVESSGMSTPVPHGITTKKHSKGKGDGKPENNGLSNAFREIISKVKRELFE